MSEWCKTCCHDDGDIGFCDKCLFTIAMRKDGLPPTEYEEEPRPQTNADRIRAMTDEELANFIATLVTVTKEGKELAEERWLDWLKQEVE